MPWPILGVLEDVSLPVPNQGTVALVKGFGLVLLCQTVEHYTRILTDIKAPLPFDLESHILDNRLSNTKNANKTSSLALPHTDISDITETLLR